MRVLLFYVGALVTAGAALGFGNVYLRQGTWLAGAASEATACDIGQVQVVSPEHAAHACLDEATLILDVRSARAFETGHAAGAVHLPCSFNRLDSVLSQRLGAAATIIVYGDGVDDAREVASSLGEGLAAEVWVIDGGYAAWEAAGQACGSGPCEACLSEKR